MDFTVLKYFQAVARNGNMTKTARELYITQPNLSKRIAQLEEEIGVPLFEHRKGKIVLNDYGRMFLSSVDIAFAELKAGMENVIGKQYPALSGYSAAEIFRGSSGNRHKAAGFYNT